MDKVLLEEKMLLLQKGDKNALKDVYQLMSKTVYLLAVSIVKDTEKAKDILQETFIRVARYIDKYQAGNAAAWITTIARHLSYREWERSKRTTSLDAISEKLEDNRGSHDERWTDNIVLYEAMAKLSNEEREIVMLYAMQGYKHREIAEIVGKSDNTVRWLYQKALKTMRENIDGKGKKL